MNPYPFPSWRGTGAGAYAKFFSTSWRPLLDSLGIKYEFRFRGPEADLPVTDELTLDDRLALNNDEEITILGQLEQTLHETLHPDHVATKGLELYQYGDLFSTPAGIALARMEFGYDLRDEARARMLWAELVLIVSKMRGEP